MPSYAADCAVDGCNSANGLLRIRRFANSTSARYAAVANAKKTKNAGGKGVKPKTRASGLNGRNTPTEIAARQVATSAALGRLRSGLFDVRIMNNTNVCVIKDSTNQPV